MRKTGMREGKEKSFKEQKKKRKGKEEKEGDKRDKGGKEKVKFENLKKIVRGMSEIE